MDFDEFVKEPFVLWTIVALARRGEPMTFRQFTEASGYWAGKAAQLRDKMERWGLIRVESKGVNGATQHISLTKHGQDAYELVLRLGKVVERGVRDKSK